MSDFRSGLRTTLLASILFTALAPLASASEDSVETLAFSATPYLWAPGSKGTVTIGNRSIPVDSSVGDTFDLLGDLDAGGAMVYLEARWRRLALFTDLSFLGINTTDSFGPGQRGSVRTKYLQYLVEYGLAYRILEHPNSLVQGLPIWVDLIAGARWNRITTEFAFARRPRDVKAKTRFTDPLVGARFSAPLWGNDAAGAFVARFRGDVGGFGVGSDLAWNVLAGLEWRPPWQPSGANFSVSMGYRTLYEDRETTTAEGESLAVQIQNGGPFLALAFAF